MPLYEYKCLKCGRTTEKIENVSGPYLKKCPHCGGKLEALISASSIQFKGSGWYITDYAAKKSGSGASASEKSSDEASDSKKTKDMKESKETKESKSESSKDSSAKEAPAKEKKSEKKK